ncbi:MAG: rhodanese-like domain-containing protein [Chloroflexi bacterium]|nr:rhodanese-like domain-containing protein [Chloroflexota bacterium]
MTTKRFEKDMTQEKGVRQEPGEPFKRIEVDVAKKMIERGGVQVVDVRRPDEYVTGHIEGSTLIPVDDLFTRVGELSETDDLIFVCEMGVRSALACEIAAVVGRTKLHNMEKGMKEWISRDYPIEK